MAFPFFGFCSILSDPVLYFASARLSCCALALVRSVISAVALFRSIPEWQSNLDDHASRKRNCVSARELVFIHSGSRRTRLARLAPLPRDSRRACACVRVLLRGRASPPVSSVWNCIPHRHSRVRRRRVGRVFLLRSLLMGGGTQRLYHGLFHHGLSASEPYHLSYTRAH